MDGECFFSESISAEFCTRKLNWWWTLTKMNFIWNTTIQWVTNPGGQTLNRWGLWCCVYDVRFRRSADIPPPTPSSPPVRRATKCAFSKICRPTPSPVWPMCVFEDRLTPSTPSFPCMWHQMCVFDLPAPSQPLPCVRLRPGNWKWQSYKRTFFCDDFKDIVEGWVLDFLIKTFFLNSYDYK